MTGEWFETRRSAGRRLCRVAAALALTAALGLVGSRSASAQSQTLTINTDRSGAGQKAAMTKIASEF